MCNESAEPLFTDGRCNVDEYLNDDLPVCMELGNDSWEADFLKQLGQEKQ